MSSLTNHFALSRRGVEAAHVAFAQSQDGEDGVELPAGAALVLLLTTLLFVGVIFAVSYTYGAVVTTLCEVEEPETNQYVAVSTLSAEGSAPPAYTPTPQTNNKNKTAIPTQPHEVGIDTEILAVRQEPITSSLRGTVLHLRARAGYWSRFRGFSLFVVLLVVRSLVVSGLALIPGMGSHGGFALANVLSDVVLARWHMTWIHIVISEASVKKWYQRIPPMKSWSKIAPAVALQSTVLQIVQIFPSLVCQSFGPMKHVRNPEFEPRQRDLYSAFGQSLMGLFLVLSLYVLLVIPASVTVTRVAASMLPEEDETIVPFDRTFGGKVTPAIIGGSGKIGILDAWKSFGWASRKRLLKLTAKVFVLIMAVWVLFSMVMVAETHILLGDKLKDILKAIHQQRGQH